MPSSMVAESLAKSMINFLRNHQTFFESTCIVFRSHQQCMRVFVDLQIARFGVVNVMEFSCSSSCVVLSHVVSVHISLMTYDVEHLSYARLPSIDLI